MGGFGGYRYAKSNPVVPRSVRVTLFLIFRAGLRGGWRYLLPAVRTFLYVGVVALGRATVMPVICLRSGNRLGRLGQVFSLDVYRGRNEPAGDRQTSLLAGEHNPTPGLNARVNSPAADFGIPA